MRYRYISLLSHTGIYRMIPMQIRLLTGDTWLHQHPVITGLPVT